MGNVKIENKDSIIEADEGTYDMNTRKVKARGHVFINHKIIKEELMRSLVAQNLCKSYKKEQ